MVFPISDDNTGRRSVPWVNYTLIGMNVFVFVAFQWFGKNDDFTYQFSVVPEKIVTGRNVAETVEYKEPFSGELVEIPVEVTPVSVYLTLLTSMFMHGGIMHILGNMWFLWIFGDNIEDVLGKVWYLVFYLVCGVLASLAHVYVTYLFSDLHSPEMYVPSLGASGAISGVLGAYLVRFPTNRVTVILFRILTQVPAYVAIGIWFLFQCIRGLGKFGAGSREGGVAYAAHVGGFVAGVVIMFAYGLIAPARRADEYDDWPEDKFRR